MPLRGLIWENYFFHPLPMMLESVVLSFLAAGAACIPGEGLPWYVYVFLCTFPAAMHTWSVYRAAVVKSRRLWLLTLSLAAGFGLGLWFMHRKWYAPIDGAFPPSPVYAAAAALLLGFAAIWLRRTQIEARTWRRHRLRKECAVCGSDIGWKNGRCVLCQADDEGYAP